MNAVNEPLQADFSTKAARKRLPPQAKPYWMTLDPGLHLGYYKGARTATWYARRFVGGRRYKQVRLGRAEESVMARGVAGMTLDQAITQARGWDLQQAGEAGQGARPTPVRNAPPGAQDSSRRLQPHRLDRISQAWASERPDVDFWLPGFFLRIEYAHYMREKRMAEVSKKAGVNVGDLHVLLAMRRFGPANTMRPTDLFRELLITSGAITKRLDRLEASGMINRVAASDDRRSGPVQLTHRGLQVADKAISQIGDSLKSLIQASGLSDKELRTLDDGFRKLISHM